MSDWVAFPLSKLAEVRVSNVDKIARLGETPVQLCNYMDVYTNDYIDSRIEFMQSTANLIEKEKFKVCSGDVIITKDSETPFDIGIPAVVMDDIHDLVCGYHLALIKPYRDKVEPVYLAKQLASNAAARYFSRMAAGSTRYGLSNGAIAATAIPIAPIEQQREIATILFTIDQAIEKTEALIHKYQQIKAGLMHDLFTRGLTADGKLRPPREQSPELYQETSIGWIPKEWDSLQMRDVSYVNQGLQIAISERYKNPGPNKYFYITIQYLNNTESEANTFYIEEHNPSVICNKDDVLLVRTGNTGMVVTNVHGVFHNNFFKISYDRRKVNRDFLVYYIQRPEIQQLILNYAGTTTIPDLKHKDFYKLPFHCPPTSEQELIAGIINSINGRAHKETRVLSKFRKLKSGLMHDLLTGKVQVTIDQEETVSV